MPCPDRKPASMILTAPHIIQETRLNGMSELQTVSDSDRGYRLPQIVFWKKIGQGNFRRNHAVWGLFHAYDFKATIKSESNGIGSQREMLQRLSAIEHATSSTSHGENSYLSDRSHFDRKVLNHGRMLSLQLLRDCRTMDQIRETFQKSEATPEGRAVIERLGENGRQTSLQALH